MSARAPILGALALLVACTTVHPPVPPSAPANAGFSHEDFDAFLLRFVNDRGRVDYTAALANRADLDRYLAQLAAVSPDSHPQRFPGEHDRLAYWLNAYNTSAISILLAHYPISSVNDVRPPRVFFFLPGRAGFFLFRRVVLGGKRTTLYSLENGLVRKRFLEPRVHFALNCAAKSCPRLPARAFTGPDLEAQLERETRRFVAEDRNVRFDPARRTLYLSSIFKWYEEDFTRWLAERRPGAERSLRGYVLLYLPETKAAPIRDCADCEVEFVRYDWGLNDQRDPAA